MDEEGVILQQSPRYEMPLPPENELLANAEKELAAVTRQVRSSMKKLFSGLAVRLRPYKGLSHSPAPMTSRSRYPRRYIGTVVADDPAARRLFAGSSEGVRLAAIDTEAGPVLQPMRCCVTL
jgi:hypothetical protein